MSIAGKLTQIAENMQKVYDAGKAEGGTPSNVYITDIDFGESGFSGINENAPKEFPHGLRKEPTFVAIYAQDMDAILKDTSSATFIIQTDRFKNNPKSYLRCAKGSVAAGVTGDTYRLIVGWDDNNVYVNSFASTMLWPPVTMTKFTMVCVAEE